MRYRGEPAARPGIDRSAARLPLRCMAAAVGATLALRQACNAEDRAAQPDPDPTTRPPSIHPVATLPRRWLLQEDLPAEAPEQCDHSVPREHSRHRCFQDHPCVPLSVVFFVAEVRRRRDAITQKSLCGGTQTIDGTHPVNAMQNLYDSYVSDKTATGSRNNLAPTSTPTFDHCTLRTAQTYRRA